MSIEYSSCVGKEEEEAWGYKCKVLENLVVAKEVVNQKLSEDVTKLRRKVLVSAMKVELLLKQKLKSHTVEKAPQSKDTGSTSGGSLDHESGGSMSDTESEGVSAAGFTSRGLGRTCCSDVTILPEANESTTHTTSTLRLLARSSTSSWEVLPRAGATTLEHACGATSCLSGSKNYAATAEQKDGAEAGGKLVELEAKEGKNESEKNATMPSVGGKGKGKCAGPIAGKGKGKGPAVGGKGAAAPAGKGGRHLPGKKTERKFRKPALNRRGTTVSLFYDAKYLPVEDEDCGKSETKAATVWDTAVEQEISADTIQDMFSTATGGMKSTNKASEQAAVDEKADLSSTSCATKNPVTSSLAERPESAVRRFEFFSKDEVMRIGVGKRNLPEGREALGEAMRTLQGMNLEQLEALKKLLPTEERMTELRQSLKENQEEAAKQGQTLKIGRVARFCLDLFEIDELRERLDVWMLLLEFDTKRTEIANHLQLVEDASRWVRGEKAVAKLLHGIVQIGNALNVGAKARERADGFGLDILANAKLEAVKPTNGGVLRDVPRFFAEHAPNKGDLPPARNLVDIIVMAQNHTDCRRVCAEGKIQLVKVAAGMGAVEMARRAALLKAEVESRLAFINKKEVARGSGAAGDSVSISGLAASKHFFETEALPQCEALVKKNQEVEKDFAATQEYFLDKIRDYKDFFGIFTQFLESVRKSYDHCKPLIDEIERKKARNYK
ncbi:unnamed protein product [Amoebophrya sp. A120]|nr:unnamed protein product [Amoebophrya sp. A120]|eukprot:GSA120T00004168001.1